MLSAWTQRGRSHKHETAEEKLIVNNSTRKIMVQLSCDKQEESTKADGFTGRGLYLFWVIVIVLLVLVIGNLLTTVILLGVLKISTGMASLEFVPDHNLMKFFGNIDLDHIINVPGLIEGFEGEPVLIDSEDGEISIQLYDSGNSRFSIEPDHIHIENAKDFKVISSESGELVFYTSQPEFGLPMGVKHLEILESQTERIESPLHSSLLLRSDTRAVIKGNEGTHLKGEEIIFKANQDVFLKAMNGSISLSNARGDGYIQIDTSHMDLVGEEVKFGIPQNKICVCGESGHLFMMPSDQGKSCDQLSHPPCSEHW